MGAAFSVPHDVGSLPSAVEMVPLQQAQEEEDAPRLMAEASARSIKQDAGNVTKNETLCRTKFSCWNLCRLILKSIVQCCCCLILALVIIFIVSFVLGFLFLRNRALQNLLGNGKRSFVRNPGDKTTYTRLGSFELLQTVNHDTRAFTEGLLVAADNTGGIQMFEGTGLHGNSELRMIDINTGLPLKIHRLPRNYFGEGIAHFRVDDELRLIQLTWKEHTAFEYVWEGPEMLGSIRSHNIPNPERNWTFHTTDNQGWGITYASQANISGDVFFISDGSSYLHTWQAKSKRQIRKVQLHYQRPDMPEQKALRYLNELEWDPPTKTVLGNVWTEDVIVRIEPVTGFVQTIYDVSTLFPKGERSFRTDVMNGIALTYDATTTNENSSQVALDEVWVTGKYWPHMYRIRLVD